MRQLLATLRHRPAPLVGSFVALATAAALVTWAFALGEAGTSSRLPVYRLSATAAVVIGRPTVTATSGAGTASASTSTSISTSTTLSTYRRLPADLATRLASLPGVAAAVPDRSVPVALDLTGGRIVGGSGDPSITGYGWQSASLTPFALRAGHEPHGTHQVVLGQGLARCTRLRVGSTVRLVGRNLPPFTVAGIAASPVGNPAGSTTLFFSDAEAAALYGHPGHADLIGVVAAAHAAPARVAARVRAALSGGPVSVLSGNRRGQAEDLLAARQLSTLGALGAGVGANLVLVSLFVVASAVALSVAERARTMALLGAVGATPGQLRRQVMGELAVVGGLGGLAGYLPGIWLASVSMDGLITHGVAPASARPWESPVALVPAVLAGIAVAELAGLLAARRASRIRPAAALQEATLERRTPRPLRLVLGLGALGGGGVLSVVALHQPDPSQQLVQAELVLLAVMGGLAFLGPYLMVLAELLLRLPLRLVGRTPGRLASAEIRSRVRRMAASVVAIALPVAFAGAVSVIGTTAIHGAAAQGRQRLAASDVVQAPGPGLAPSVLEAIRAEPGVVAAVGLVPTTVVLPSTAASTTAAEAVTPGPIGRLLHLGVASGTLTGFEPGDVALSQLAAGKGAMNVAVGQKVTVHLADGTPYRATLIATYTRALGFANALVPAGAGGGGHLGSTTVGEVLVRGAPGLAPTLLARRLASLARAYPGLRVAGRSVVNAQSSRLTAQSVYVNNLVLALIGLLAGVALVNTLVVATLQSREETALLARVGATARQLVAAAAWRTAEVTVVGLVLGAGAAAVPVAGVAKALTGSWTPTVGWTPMAVVIGAVVVLTAGATGVPLVALLRAGRRGDR